MTTGARPDVRAAAQALRSRFAGRQPVAAIVLGSGLGGLVDRMTDTETVSYADIPGFPGSTVVGHKGELVLGRLGGVEVVAQSGRFHLYEGHDADTVALPARALAESGVGTLVVTNAAGGIRRTFRPGTLMAIADHVNLTFRNPLVGAVLDGEERFPDMSAPYDAELRAAAHRAAAERGIPLADGVYAAVLGPSYETPAEIRMLERLGVDAVGMSTVPEVIAAVARGMRCLGFSTITNPASGLGLEPLAHEDVLDIGRRAGHQLADIIEGVVAGL